MTPNKSKAHHEAAYNDFMRQAKEELESYIINGHDTELGWAIQHAIQAKQHKEEFMRYVDEKVEK